MKVCVVGLWHLGSVTAACLAASGHTIIGLDFDEDVIRNLQSGKAPLYEPGLDKLILEGIDQGCLSFTSNPQLALEEAQLVWVTYDTPVDEDDRADVEYVIGQVKRIFHYLPEDATVLISSQLPVGTTRSLEKQYLSEYKDRQLGFAYSPENLRLGKAINVFTHPDRVVVGLSREVDRVRINSLLEPFTDQIEWMSIESAEMTKHAINAFLATSVTFINEIAALCEKVGADAKDVERGLKSESRIGPKAYLKPGSAFAGGTLARDIVFLNQLGQTNQVPVHLFNAVLSSNQEHKAWSCRRLSEVFNDMGGKTIAVWGLTYKPDTSTLRRSSSVELCHWLIEQGARVQAHDPAIHQLPGDLAEDIFLCATPLEAVSMADALVIATEWPTYLAISAKEVVDLMRTPWVIDANRFLSKTMGDNSGIHYLYVGKPI